MRDAEIAWAAGLFEGEGCFAYTPNHVRAELAMTDHDTVRRFQAVVGNGSLYLKKRPSERHKPQLVWRVTDRAGVEAVLELLRPWLGARRVGRGDEILAIQAKVSAEREQARARTCRNGHVRTAENTRLQPRKSGPPYRRCLDCDRERVREYRARQAGAR